MPERKPIMFLQTEFDELQAGNGTFSFSGDRK